MNLYFLLFGQRTNLLRAIACCCRLFAWRYTSTTKYLEEVKILTGPLGITTELIRSSSLYSAIVYFEFYASSSPNLSFAFCWVMPGKGEWQWMKLWWWWWWLRPDSSDYDWIVMVMILMWQWLRWCDSDDCDGLVTTETTMSAVMSPHNVWTMKAIMVIVSTCDLYLIRMES